MVVVYLHVMLLVVDALLLVVDNKIGDKVYFGTCMSFVLIGLLLAVSFLLNLVVCLK